MADSPGWIPEGGEMRERPRWLLVTYVAVQVALPAIALWLRLSGGPATSRFGWQMFSTAA